MPEIINKQLSFLSVYSIPISKRPSFFSSKKNLKLTSFGYKKFKEHFNFREIQVTHPLSIKDIRECCLLNQEMFYVSNDLLKIYCLDKAFIALCTVFNGENKAIF